VPACPLSGTPDSGLTKFDNSVPRPFRSPGSRRDSLRNTPGRLSDDLASIRFSTAVLKFTIFALGSEMDRTSPQ
jgi:hypothetical protein